MDFRGLGRSGWMSWKSHTAKAVPAGELLPTHSSIFPRAPPSSQLPPGSRCQGPGLAAALPGQSCCRKVYVATSRAAELERPPPRGMSLAMTALKPGTGPPAGREGKRGP